MKLSRLLFPLGVLIFFVLFVVRGVIILDPDFGWHFQIGNYILHHGFPRGDPFSYTMPQYNFVYTEWLTEIIFANLYPIVSQIVLAILFSLLAVGAVVLQTIGKKYRLVPFLLVSASLLSLFRVNPQVVSWFFFSLLITILFDKTLWQKTKFVLPLLFVVWANMHGAVAMGIGTLFLFICGDAWEKKKLSWSNIFVFLGCFFITLVNPYGVGLWQEIIMQGLSRQNREISEWAPAFTAFFPSLWMWVVFSVFFVYRERKRLSFPQLLVYGILLIGGLSSIRNIAFWLLVSLPLTTHAIGLFYKHLSNIPHGQKRFAIAAKIFFCIVLLTTVVQEGIDIPASKSYSLSVYYPVQAVAYLRSHPTTGNIFSLYGWGGYLIWQYPEKKVFIDGRMSPWVTGVCNGKTSCDAFADYQHITNGEVRFAPFVKKYHITTVLLPISNAQKINGIDNLFMQWGQKLFGAKKAPYPDIFTQLKKMGWKKVYEDKIAVIYLKN